jgi:hypothetical protein
MPYNEQLAARIDELLKGEKNFTSKKMFGGVGYVLNRNMCIGIHKDDLIIRCDPADTDILPAEKNVKVFDITGKPMKGWLLYKGD